MKKLFAMMLSAAMMLSLAACGGTEEPAPAEPDPAPEAKDYSSMTNDGAFTQMLTHPSGKVTKTYRVSVTPAPTEEHLIALSTGVRLDDGHFTAPARVRVTGGDGTERGTMEMVLTEGHNREIRRMCDAVGLTVTRLKRTSVGPLKLGTMKAGEIRELTRAEVIALRRSATGK